MVIQRSWRIPSRGSISDSWLPINQPQPSTSSSEYDSQNDEIMSKTIKAISSLTSSTIIDALEKQYIEPKKSFTPIKSLELLREFVQDDFDQEINKVVQSYLENFFNSALKNLRENVGEQIVPDDILRTIACNLLENSKNQYLKMETVQNGTSVSRANSPKMQLSDSDSLSFDEGIISSNILEINRKDVVDFDDEDKQCFFLDNSLLSQAQYLDFSSTDSSLAILDDFQFLEQSEINDIPEKTVLPPISTITSSLSKSKTSLTSTHATLTALLYPNTAYLSHGVIPNDKM